MVYKLPAQAPESLPEMGSDFVENILKKADSIVC